MAVHFQSHLSDIDYFPTTVCPIVIYSLHKQYKIEKNSWQWLGEKVNVFGDARLQWT